MSMMKAALVTDFSKPLEIREVRKPTVTDGNILVKIEACGVCHTDLHAARGDWPVKPEPPFIPGHEGVGVVVEVGHNVTSVKEGDRVGVPWLHHACGHCTACVTGWETLCRTEPEYTGYTVNGGFAEYVEADPTYVGHLPDKLDFAPAAPILCAGVTVYKGLKECDLHPGQTVVISGIGGLGHLAVQYARAMGLHVIAVDVAEDKLALARDLGAGVAINAATQDPVAEVARLGGAEGVLVTAVSNTAFSQGVGMLAPGGTMSLVGLPPGDFPLNIFDVVLNRKTIRGSIVGTRADLAESLSFAAEGKVASHYATDSLDNINGIFDQMEQGRIEGRIVMTM
ncbi:alcohol dehydrogenase GroES domain protein [Dinoroseobacter shibae DFL 12 = DSM 16493]|uniref:alcohol dehydrogenase n=1 Tax=Dinoroseobacter shibae (strain DSM 16493 / NCIMB 14021 / DFL 12) TaxID=398580 RepID=A8LRW9_DINSH|nr:alcohol dehydrogenase AdhP [Dinoroseobacter shibae]ABV92676.1 alcohol dehydrogenase GroES domain protein [Dinoroseobacter shibae DFL 12 = DSM 16493]URF47612.1 alcohol dehydrogenase AdhP [Dinoroseobacter shibae]URF51922.1 alcohol dehydrogenase AdhP [Dinoroseobacter shibae]